MATLFTTVFAGAYLAHFDHDFFRFWTQLKYQPGWWIDGLAFAAPLMAILLSHELGHYLMSRYHGVRSSLPFFIPGPNLVGTFGAVIIMKGRIPDRRALFDIGAAGPLAGLVVTLFTMILGFAFADVICFDGREVELFFEVNFPQGAVLFDMNLLERLVFEAWPWYHSGNCMAVMSEAADSSSISHIIHSPLLDAAAVGFLVTMLNLLPIGQLDGGHIAYSVLGKRAWWLGWVCLAGVLVMGVLYWLPWLMMGLLLVFLMGFKGLKHPPPENPEVGLTRGRIILAVIVLVIFILIVSPIPVSVYVPP
jgi:membrane-associated protease RseP (regulator of RpoE activity)